MKDMEVYEMNMRTELDRICEGEELRVVYAYHPDDSPTDKGILHQDRENCRETIFCGDFNVKSQVWGNND